MRPAPPPFTPQCFISVDPARNRYRFYRLVGLADNLFGELELTVVSGRLGSRGARVRYVPCSDAAEGLWLAERLVRRRSFKECRPRGLEPGRRRP